MDKELLPLGTVVRLTGGTKKLMVEGYHVKSADDDKIYTYCACIWPEGHMENKFCLFDTYQIEEICFNGFQNDESKAYEEKINSMLLNGTTINGLENNPKDNQENHRGRIKRNPNKAKSKSEMLNQYGITKISGENVKNMRKY